MGSVRTTGGRLARGTSRPPSSISRPRFGLADRPARIRDRALIRRLIWATSLATGKISHWWTGEVVEHQLHRAAAHGPDLDHQRVTAGTSASGSGLGGRVHSETGQTPLARFDAAGAPRCRPRRCCARRSCGRQERTVTKTATVSLHGNDYEVDPALVGRKVRAGVRPVRSDPDRGPLPAPAVRDSRCRCVIGRHIHPQAERELAAATGADRNRLPRAARRAARRRAGRRSGSTTQASPSPTATARIATINQEGRSG